MIGSKKVLSIGIDPYLIDFSSPEFAAFPGMNADKVAEGVKNSIDQLKDAGYAAEKLWIDFGTTAVSVVEEKLNNEFDIILIGAGIRVPPSNLLLFEKLINLIHAKAPNAKIVFNSTPKDGLDAVRRWS